MYYSTLAIGISQSRIMYFHNIALSDFNVFVCKCFPDSVFIRFHTCLLSFLSLCKYSLCVLFLRFWHYDVAPVCLFSQRFSLETAQ